MNVTVNQINEIISRGEFTEDDSASIKRFLDTANTQDRRVIARAFPAEFDEWMGELEDGQR